MSDEQILIELDDRRRASLGKLGEIEHRRYLAHEEPGGVIVLVPAVVVSAAEAALAANPQLAADIDRAIYSPAVRRRRGRPAHKD